MSSPKYRKQVQLLLNILPFVAQEECFALHGGTAINLFIRNMPRLSVDIDLTYLTIENRQATLQHIDNALKRIKTRIKAARPDTQILYKPQIAKLMIRANNHEIKLEVNLVARGTIETPQKMMLCNSAQQMYETSSVIQIVRLGQLYGGKICAALDRQHPRDLFDVKLLMDNEGFTDDIKTGFLLSLCSSDRPIHEIISPHLLDQRLAMKNQFTGMSNVAFTYDDFEKTRHKLINDIKRTLNKNDKTFLLGFNNAQPDWTLCNFEHFPAVQWKLQNLKKLININAKKHKHQQRELTEKLQYS